MPPHDSENAEMPLWQHLDELRQAIFRSLIALSIGFAIAYYFSDELVHFLEQPLLQLLPEGRAHLYYTGLTDKFVVYLKVCLVAGLFFISPYLLYEIWRFVSPGLVRNEKRFLVPFLFFGTVSFVLGLVFAYTVVIPYGYAFLIGFGSPTDQAIITLTEYFGLTLKLLLALGLVFEVPVALVLLGKFGIVDSKMLARNRRYAAVAASVVAAVATPSPDAMTMILVLIPLYLLYEAGVLGVRLVERTAS